MAGSAAASTREGVTRGRGFQLPWMADAVCIERMRQIAAFACMVCRFA